MAAASGQNTPFNAGFELIDGSQLNRSLADRLGASSWANGLVGLGTTQATALQLTQRLNKFTTIASGTGVALPAANAGDIVLIDVRLGSNAIQVYGKIGSSDTVDTVAGSTGVTLTNTNLGAMFVCFTSGAWTSMKFGAIST